jgi:hypothetical protein
VLASTTGPSGTPSAAAMVSAADRALTTARRSASACAASASRSWKPTPSKRFAPAPSATSIRLADLVQPARLHHHLVGGPVPADPRLLRLHPRQRPDVVVLRVDRVVERLDVGARDARAHQRLR